MQTTIDVLVVDDSDSHTRVTLQALRHAAPGATIIRLKDGDQALQFMFCTGGFSSRAPQMPHLILLEVKIPLISGLQVLDRLRCYPTTRDIPVVLLTTVRSPIAMVHSYQMGAKAYIVKPTDIDEYCAEVKRSVDRWLH